MDPLLRQIRAREMYRTGQPEPRDFQRLQTTREARCAVECARSWLEEIARMDLGHEGDHAVAEALRHLLGVRDFLRREATKSR